MAKEEKLEEQQQAEETANETTAGAKGGSKSSGGMFGWILPIVIAVVLGAGSFIAGQFVSNAKSAPVSDEQLQADRQQAEKNEKKKKDKEKEKSKEKQGDPDAPNWYHPLEPVVATLNEPSTLRYARAGLTLEISGELDQIKGKEILDVKVPVINSWLTIYLASMTLEDLRGEKNLRRMQLQVLDSLNEMIFSDDEPYIKRVLLREFAIQ